MHDLISRVERYRMRANKYGEMAKTAEPRYLRNLYLRDALRYVFMAEELRRRADRRPAPQGASARGRRSWRRPSLEFQLYALSPTRYTAI
jgi:hypothetical protein